LSTRVTALTLILWSTWWRALQPIACPTTSPRCLWPRSISCIQFNGLSRTQIITPMIGALMSVNLKAISMRWVNATHKKLNVKIWILEPGLSDSHEKQSAFRSWKQCMIRSSDYWLIRSNLAWIFIQNYRFNPLPTKECKNGLSSLPENIPLLVIRRYSSSINISHCNSARSIFRYEPVAGSPPGEGWLQQSEIRDGEHITWYQPQAYKKFSFGWHTVAGF